MALHAPLTEIEFVSAWTWPGRTASALPGALLDAFERPLSPRRVSAEQPLTFRFHWIDGHGRRLGLLRRPGAFDGATLELDDARIPVASIQSCAVRDAVLALTIRTSQPQQPRAIALLELPRPGLAEQLQLGIQAARSGVRAQAHRQQLAEDEELAQWRAAECPACGAVVVLSGLPPTPQTYCPICDSLTTSGADQEQLAHEAGLHRCERCSLFARTREFVCFYFYFLLVACGWRRWRTRRCPPCMRGDAWRMLLGNLPFLLGTPGATLQLVNSCRPWRAEGDFRGLDEGNRRYRAGELARAAKHFEDILQRVPCSAGVRFNLAKVRLAQGEPRQAMSHLEAALQDCANYPPAYAALKRLYVALGEGRKLQRLDEAWSAAQSLQPSAEYSA